MSMMVFPAKIEQKFMAIIFVIHISKYVSSDIQVMEAKLEFLLME
jgi:hypothetical protein